MSRISRIQLYLCSTAEDLVSSADAGADLVILRLGMAVRVKLRLSAHKSERHVSK